MAGVETIAAQIRADIESHIDEHGLVGQQTPEQLEACRLSMEDWLTVRWSALLGRKVVVELDVDSGKARIDIAADEG